MIEICPIHYKIKIDELLTFYEQNSKKIHLTLEEALKNCQQKHISIEYKNLYSFIKDHEVRIYSNNMLIYVNDISEGFEPASFTPAFLGASQVKDIDAMERSILEVITTGFVLAFLAENKKMSYKKRHGTFYEIYELKDAPITMKRYECGTDLFTVREKWGKVSFVCNHILRKSFSLPSNQYQMPNRNPIRVFRAENTKDVEDINELNQLLTDIPESIGKCYSTCSAIMKKAEESGYAKRHKVEYYAGWTFLIYADKIVHHAWIVIDDIHVIDMTMKKSGEMKEFLDSSEKGIYKPFSRELLAEWTHKEIEEHAAYSKYHFCGKAEDCIYIGTKCTEEEAKESFRTMLTKGNLPGYKYTSKDQYENKFQTLYQKKYGGS